MTVVPFSPRARPPAASVLPAVGLAVSVRFLDHPRAYPGTIVGLLAAPFPGRVVLVRLAVEDGPRHDDFRAVWFAAAPTEGELAGLALVPSSYRQACFP